jgi:hypothetical protein
MDLTHQAFNAASVFFFRNEEKEAIDLLSPYISAFGIVDLDETGISYFGPLLRGFISDTSTMDLRPTFVVTTTQELVFLKATIFLLLASYYWR